MTDLMEPDESPDLISTWHLSRSNNVQDAYSWSINISLISPLMGQPTRAEAQAEVDRILDDVLGVDTLNPPQPD